MAGRWRATPGAVADGHLDTCTVDVGTVVPQHKLAQKVVPMDRVALPVEEQHARRTNLLTGAQLEVQVLHAGGYGGLALAVVGELGKPLAAPAHRADDPIAAGAQVEERQPGGGGPAVLQRERGRPIPGLAKRGVGGAVHANGASCVPHGLPQLIAHVLEVIVSPVAAVGAAQLGHLAVPGALPKGVEGLEIGDGRGLFGSVMPQPDDPFHRREFGEFSQLHDAGESALRIAPAQEVETFPILPLPALMRGAIQLQPFTAGAGAAGEAERHIRGMTLRSWSW